jgi:hypothetical protein
MPRCEEQTNKFDGQVYVASIIPTKNRLQIPIKIGDIPIEPIRFDYLIFQAAVYPKQKIHSWRLAVTLPTLVINLDCLPDRISENEFAEFVSKLLMSERISDTYSEGTYQEIYRSYGFESVRYDIRPFLRFKKVKNIIIFQTPESRAAKTKGEILNDGQAQRD